MYVCALSESMFVIVVEESEFSYALFVLLILSHIFLLAVFARPCYMLPHLQ